MAVDRPISFIGRHKHSLAYAGVLAGVLLLLRWAEIHFIIISHAAGSYTLFIAFLFTALGIWLALKLARPKTKIIIVHKKAGPIPVPVFSRREIEVLEALAKGWSNKEMAAALFVSENTIKTHLSSLFAKLEVNRRTQAVGKAQLLGIISKNIRQTGEKQTPGPEITQKYE
jgi:DNA-binding CsgD family transcriptional regulator